MIWLLDFNDRPVGLYSREWVPLTVPKKGQITITSPDLEAFATIATETAIADYFPITIEDVNSGKVSVDAMKNVKHVVLIYGWELSALLKKIHLDHFELSFGGGERLKTVSFGLGEPLE